MMKPNGTQKQSEEKQSLKYHFERTYSIEMRSLYDDTIADFKIDSGSCATQALREIQHAIKR
jgi:hypothetical protein